MNSNQTASAGHFENQYVKFELPAGVTAKDTSNDTSFDIILFKNGRDIGEINSAVTPPQALNAIDGSNTTFQVKMQLNLMMSLEAFCTSRLEMIVREIISVFGLNWIRDILKIMNTSETHL